MTWCWCPCFPSGCFHFNDCFEFKWIFHFQPSNWTASNHFIQIDFFCVENSKNRSNDDDESTRVDFICKSHCQLFVSSDLIYSTRIIGIQETVDIAWNWHGYRRKIFQMRFPSPKAVECMSNLKWVSTLSSCSIEDTPQPYLTGSSNLRLKFSMLILMLLSDNYLLRALI